MGGLENGRITMAADSLGFFPPPLPPLPPRYCQHQICNAHQKGGCPREQMMGSNVSILDTEAAQAIVLLGIEDRLVEVGG